MALSAEVLVKDSNINRAVNRDKSFFIPESP
jgi:hypothetical protein